MPLVCSDVPTGPYGGVGHVYTEENQLLVSADKGPSAEMSNMLNSESALITLWGVICLPQRKRLRLNSISVFLMGLLQDVPGGFVCTFQYLKVLKNVFTLI